MKDDKVGQKYSLRKLIKSDVTCCGGYNLALQRLGFYTALFYRLSHYLSRKNFKLLAALIQISSQIVTGAEISHKADIGSGLYFLHPSGVLIGPNIKIGKNAMICECASIVYMDDEAPPVIGDFLWLGPGGRITGNVIIGDRVRVGPNSVVLKNIDSHMIAFGIPARVIGKNLFSKKSRKTPSDHT